MESFPNRAGNENYLLAGRVGQHDRSAADAGTVEALRARLPAVAGTV
jgi:hypothetical protein